MNKQTNGAAVETLSFVSVLHTAPVVSSAKPAVSVRRIDVKPVDVAALIAATLASK